MIKIVVASVGFIALAVSAGAMRVDAAAGAETVDSSTQTSPEPGSSSASTKQSWRVPNIEALPNDTWGQLVRNGRDLVVATYAHLGPEAPDPAQRFSGTNMSCQNCHLEAGTKQFGLPFRGVFADFPQYRAREGEVGTLEDRVNGCMTRSMNGRALPLDSRAMKAYLAYIKFVSDGIPIDAKTVGRGSGKMVELSRPADVEHGKAVFAANCAACHGDDGLGKRIGSVGDGKGYEFPPVWGPDSFNDGAGMNRLIAAANFVHANMPNGTNIEDPILSPEDAWDVAAYIQAQPRPRKEDLEADFPHRLEKPVDAGYGPYADSFSVEQHRLGPFEPIRAALKAMRVRTPPAAGAPSKPTPTPSR